MRDSTPATSWARRSRPWAVHGRPQGSARPRHTAPSSMPSTTPQPRPRRPSRARPRPGVHAYGAFACRSGQDGIRRCYDSPDGISQHELCLPVLSRGSRPGCCHCLVRGCQGAWVSEAELEERVRVVRGKNEPLWSFCSDEWTQRIARRRVARARCAGIHSAIHAWARPKSTDATRNTGSGRRREARSGAEGCHGGRCSEGSESEAHVA